MSRSPRALIPLFERERAVRRPAVLATVTRTEGPTYSKGGAQMLIAQGGEYAGLLSGGCLEGDLAERSQRVFADGQPQVVRYDGRGPDDLLFGLGSGCEGSMDILLQRLDPESDWQPLTRLVEAWRARRPESLRLVVRSDDRSFPVGGGVFESDGFPFGGLDATAAAILLAADRPGDAADCYVSQAAPGIDLLHFTVSPSPRVLLLGAGPDALPVAELASFLGWHLTIIDHRPHYARVERFPTAELVLESGPAGLAELLSSPRGSGAFAAAIVMSHHFLADRDYLQALANTEIPYIGLLGPVSRRERLLPLIGPQAARLRKRLCSPVGLDLGADSPESIALAIAAEIQGRLAGRSRIEPLSQQSELRVPGSISRRSDPVRT